MQQRLDLKNRVTIITGACRGLGLTMAEAVLEAGGRLVATSVDAGGLAAACAVLAERHGGDRILDIVGDVSAAQDCQRVVAAALDRFGSIDGLVNNAGLGMSFVNSGRENKIPFWEAEPDRWVRVIEVNVIGSFLMANAVTPHLLKQGRGRIVNVTTSLGHIHSPFVTPYGPSKVAIEAMTVAWAKELGDLGVTVNSLLPGGPTDTLMVPESYRATGQPLLAPTIMKLPITWLLSDASDGHTGGRYVARNWSVSGSHWDALEMPVFRSA